MRTSLYENGTHALLTQLEPEHTPGIVAAHAAQGSVTLLFTAHFKAGQTDKAANARRQRSEAGSQAVRMPHLQFQVHVSCVGKAQKQMLCSLVRFLVCVKQIHASQGRSIGKKVLQPDLHLVAVFEAE